MILKRKLILWYYKNREPYKTRRALREFRKAILLNYFYADAWNKINRISASAIPANDKFILCLESINRFVELKKMLMVKNNIEHTLLKSLNPDAKYKKGGIVTAGQMGMVKNGKTN
jgi:hypothetical protein